MASKGRDYPSSQTMLLHKTANNEKEVGIEEADGLLSKPTWQTFKGAFAKAGFILGSVILVTICLRNSLTWHLARIWGGCREYVWQNLWDQLIERTGDDPYFLYVYGSIILTTLVYFPVGAIYTYMDFNLSAREYKVQPSTNEPINKDKFWKVLRTVVFNQTVLLLPFNIVMYQAHKYRGIRDVRILPSFQEVIFELVIYLLVEELLFYYFHWGLHHKSVYKYIHKKHHEWTASVAFISLYSHPLEHVLSNLLPVAMGPLLCGSHISVAWLWFSMALLNTLNSHSGYHLPFLPSPEAHDFHHLKFNQCYGVLGILDYLHGTDTQFRSNIAYQRNIMLLSTKPARELLPDVKQE